MKDFVMPPSLDRGDKVGIVAPGNGPSKNRYPEVYELGLERIRNVFDLEPVEFPSATKSTEYLTNHPKERAEEVMEAFEDPEIKGVITPLGGTGEQVRILKHLDPETLKNNPTRFYGYSDNTSLALYLWNLGIISFQGPGVMTEFAIQGEMFDYTVEYAEKAFFEDGIGEVEPADEFTDDDLDWEDSENLEKKRETEPNPGWEWYNANADSGDGVVEGRIWGGCLDVLEINLQSDKPLPDKEELEGCVLALETSEGLPSHDIVDLFMMSMGERGLLERFSAIIVGRAKARNLFEQNTKEEREEYRENQKQAIKRRVDEYAPGTPIIFDFDFGHISPIVPLPIGGKAVIDTDEKTLKLE